MAMYFEMDESDGSKNNAIRAEPASMSAFAQWTAGTAVSQFGRPEADVLNQSYTTQAGGSTNLYQGLDELVASDTDYIISPVDPSNKVYVTRLSDVTDPLSSVNHVVRYRYRKSGTSVLNLDVQLRQGYASEVSQGTLIASWSHADISTTAVTAGQALSAAEANAISNYIQMHLRFNFNIPSFGPLTGVAAIKAGAGPRTVSSPGGGVSFNTGSNIQTLIDANPANTMFVTSTPGTYTNFRNLNITGDHPRFWFVGAAASYNITGAGERFGFDGVGGIEVRGGTWSGYGVQGPGPSYATPIHATGGTTQSVVEDAILTGNEVGVLMHGNTSTGVGTTVSHCTMSNNFRYGCTGGGSVSGQIANILEYCILDNNNTGGRAHLTSPSYNPGGDASATKFVYGNGDIARYNWVKNNYGFGLWWDSYVSNLLIHDNVCENNTSADIFMEVVYGGTVVEHNYCNNTGLGDPTSVPAYGAVNNPFNNAGILVSCADASGNSTGPFPGINDTSEVRYNDLDCSNRANGVALIDGTWHPEAATRNWSVHHNRIYERGTVAQAARTGLYDVSNRNLITSVAANNHFNYNEYHVATVGSTYYIADSAMTFAQFRAAGHEANGTEVVI
jgi:hypothetical protein